MTSLNASYRYKFFECNKSDLRNALFFELDQILIRYKRRGLSYEDLVFVVGIVHHKIKEKYL